MSDPRGRGFKRSNAFRHSAKPKLLDRPTNHGWTEASISEVDGCVIFSLDDIAQMKADLNIPSQWIGNVLVNGKWQGFTIAGSLDWITEQIRKKARNDL
jgi:hypothetical protein